AYLQLVKNFADNKSLVEKASGALRRLASEGKALELSGEKVGGGPPFDIKQLNGKVVVVYYWAKLSTNQYHVNDFAQLKKLLDTYRGKGLEVVCVNLDSDLKEVSSSGAPGVQLLHKDGLEGPLATHYGITVLPHLFLVDAQGKVVSRTVQITNLEDEI